MKNFSLLVKGGQEIIEQKAREYNFEVLTSVRTPPIGATLLVKDISPEQNGEHRLEEWFNEDEPSQTSVSDSKPGSLLLFDNSAWENN